MGEREKDEIYPAPKSVTPQKQEVPTDGHSSKIAWIRMGMQC